MDRLIDIPKYFSQFDGDTYWYYENGRKKSGTCVETCLKMIDHYLTGREVAIKDIVKHGDNNPRYTTIQGAQQSANWLGFHLFLDFWSNEWLLKTHMKDGRLVIALVNYGKIPAKYKQAGETYQGDHAILITGVSDNGQAIRYADPIFRGAHRHEGWMNNNKWIAWDDLRPAWEASSNFGLNKIALVCERRK